MESETNLDSSNQSPQEINNANLDPVANDQSLEATKPPLQEAQAPISFNSPTPQAPGTQNPAPQINELDINSHKKGSNIGVMILQWLTYAFWGWAVLSLSALTVSTLAFIIGDADTSNFTPYGIAATLTLMPIALVCDIFYTKNEPLTKRGAEIAIATIHAVIFALFGVGSLISAVISMVTMYTSSSDTKNSLIALVSSLIITIYYGLTFLRTLDIKKLTWYKKVFRIIMMIFVAIAVVSSILGPLTKERQRRTDKLIESNLYSLSEKINSYARNNNKLPEGLRDLDLKDDVKKLVDDNLVTYKPEGSGTTNKLNSYYTNSATSTFLQTKYFKYQLCVNYKYKGLYGGTYDSYDNLNENDIYDGYKTSPATYGHKSGEVCYKLRTGY